MEATSPSSFADIEWLPLLQEVSDSLLSNSAFLVSSVVSVYFRSNLAYPFAIAATTQLLSLIVIKIGTQFRIDILLQVETKALELHQKYSKIQLTALIVVAVTHAYFPVISCIFATYIGAFTAFTADVLSSKRMQESYPSAYDAV